MTFVHEFSTNAVTDPKERIDPGLTVKGPYESRDVAWLYRNGRRRTKEKIPRGGYEGLGTYLSVLSCKRACNVAGGKLLGACFPAARFVPDAAKNHKLAEISAFSLFSNLLLQGFSTFHLIRMNRKQFKLINEALFFLYCSLLPMKTDTDLST